MSIVPENRNFAPRKGMGQNFLKDRGMARRMVACLEAGKGEPVLEIGPGRGALTRHLLEAGASVTAVEFDDFLAGELPGAFPEADLTVINRDILTFDLTAWTAEKGYGPVKVLGNLPYNISHRIMAWVETHMACISGAWLTLQREVVDRLAAEPGTKDYGAVTVGINSRFTVKRLMQLPAWMFAPKPKVGSSYFKLTPRENAGEGVADQGRFRSFVGAAFAHRRKKLRNNLSRSAEGFTGLGREELERIGERADIDLDRRPETLTPAEFVRLAAAAEGTAG